MSLFKHFYPARGKEIYSQWAIWEKIS